MDVMVKLLTIRVEGRGISNKESWPEIVEKRLLFVRMAALATFQNRRK